MLEREAASPSQCSSRGIAAVITTACSKPPCGRHFCRHLVPALSDILIPPIRRTHAGVSGPALLWLELEKIRDHPADVALVSRYDKSNVAIAMIACKSANTIRNFCRRLIVRKIISTVKQIVYFFSFLYSAITA